MKQIRNRFSVLVASVQFNIPSKIFPKMLCDLATTMNMMPTARSKPSTPCTIVTGEKLSRKVDMKVPFGTCVVVKELDKSASDGREVLGLVVGRDPDSRGAVIVYAIDSGRFLVRSSVRVAQLTEDIVKKINKQAEASRPEPGSEIITMGGKPIRGSSSGCSVPVLLPQLIEPKGTTPEVLTPLPMTPIEPTVVVPADSDQRAGVVGDVVHPLTTDVPMESQLSSSVTDIATNPPSLPEIVEATSEAPAQGYGSIVVEGQRKTLRKTTNWKSKLVSRYLSKQREYVQRVSTIGSNNRLCAFRLSLKKATVQFPGLAEDAAVTEMAQLVDTGAIIPVFAAPKDEKVIHSQLMITPKYDVDGRLDKVKGRLVASGNEVDPSTFTSISETSAPTMKFEGLMTLLSASSFHNSPIGLLDFPGAFLKAFLTRIQNVMLGRDAAQALLKVHPEYKKFLRKDGTMVVKVVRALYGLPESGKLWYNCLSSFLVVTHSRRQIIASFSKYLVEIESCSGYMLMMFVIPLHPNCWLMNFWLRWKRNLGK